MNIDQVLSWLITAQSSELRAIAAKTADLLAPAALPPPAICPDDEYAYGVPYEGEISYAMHPANLADYRASRAATFAVSVGGQHIGVTRAATLDIDLIKEE